MTATAGPSGKPSLLDADRRPGETVAILPPFPDESLYFIGVIRTPWASRQDCPKRGDVDGPACQIDLDPRWDAALDDVESAATLQVLYWMHLSRRDLTRQRPRSSGRLVGTFALRSPMRPNPIASSTVRLVRRSGLTLVVRGLDCVDGTPLIDIKPERCPIADAPASGAGG